MSRLGGRFRFTGLLALSVACDEVPTQPGPDPLSKGPAAALEVTGDTVVADDDGAVLMAVVRDAEGRVITGARVRWTSLDSTTATMAHDGTVMPVDIGYVTVRASLDSLTDDHRLRVAATNLAPGEMRFRVMGRQSATWSTAMLAESPMSNLQLRYATLRGAHVQAGERDTSFVLEGVLEDGTSEIAGSGLPHSHATMEMDGPGPSRESWDATGGALVLATDYPERPGLVLGSASGWLDVTMMPVAPAAGAAITIHAAFRPALEWRPVAAVLRYLGGGLWLEPQLTRAEARMGARGLVLEWTEPGSAEGGPEAVRTLRFAVLPTDSVELQDITRAQFEAGDWPDVFAYVDHPSLGRAGGATSGYVRPSVFMEPSEVFYGWALGTLAGTYALTDSAGALVQTDSVFLVFDIPIMPTRAP